MPRSLDFDDVWANIDNISSTPDEASEKEVTPRLLENALKRINPLEVDEGLSSIVEKGIEKGLVDGRDVTDFLTLGCILGVRDLLNRISCGQYNPKWMYHISLAVKANQLTNEEVGYSFATGVRSVFISKLRKGLNQIGGTNGVFVRRLISGVEYYYARAMVCYMTGDTDNGKIYADKITEYMANIGKLANRKISSEMGIKDNFFYCRLLGFEQSMDKLRTEDIEHMKRQIGEILDDYDSSKM